MFSREEIGAQAKAFGLAIGIHALMAALIVLGTMNWQPFRKPQIVAMTIEAVMVDTSEILKQRDEAKQAVEKEKLRDDRAERLKEQQKREEEQKKLEDEKKLQQQKKEEDLKREREVLEEKKRQEDLDARKKREAKEKLDKLRQEQEKQKEAERLKKQQELDDMRKQAEAAEKDRKLEAEKLKQIEAKRQQEDLDKRKAVEEAALQKKLADEEREFLAGQVATLSDNYQAAIQQFVTQNWLRPPTAQAGLRCKLKIVQIPGGEVISAAIAGSCNADEATRRSIVAAVERGGSLPYRGFEKAFEREIDFIFIYDGE